MRIRLNGAVLGHVLALLACVAVPTVRAQDPKLVTYCDRVDALYGQGDLDGQERCVDSVLALGSAPRDLLCLARIFKARLHRTRGEARAALTALDSISADSLIEDPLVLYACAEERARALKQLGRLPRAIIEVDRALHIARSRSLGRRVITSLILKAELERRQGFVNIALSLLVEAEKLEEKEGYPLAHCNLLINRGNILYAQARIEEALSKYHEARECALSNGFRQLVVNTVFNEAGVLYRMDEDSLGAAISVYEKALADPWVRADKRYEADIRGALAMMYSQQGRTTEALASIERSLDIRRELNDTLSQAQELITLASVYLKTDRAEQALGAATQSLDLSRANHSLDLEAEALLKMNAILKELGRYKEANEYLEQYVTAKDTLGRRTYGEETLDIEYKYGLEKKEAQIVDAQAKTRRRELQLTGSVIIAALLLVVLALVLRNSQHLRKVQAQTRLLHEQQVNDLLKQQEIRSLDAMLHGQEQERKRVAKDLHDRLGTMLSTIKLRFSALQGRVTAIEEHHQNQYENAFGLLDEAVVEVRRISHDMVRGSLAQFGLAAALQDLCDTLRTPGKMEVELGVFGLERRLEGKLEIAVYRIVQEAVGNVLKHAKATELSIQVTRVRASLNVIVEDNGGGFDPEQMTEGMGMGNLRERAAAFGGVVSVDSRVGHGTTVTIDFPLNAAGTTT